jgi:hypothetical protein
VKVFTSTNSDLELSEISVKVHGIPEEIPEKIKDITRN